MLNDPKAWRQDSKDFGPAASAGERKLAHKRKRDEAFAYDEASKFSTRENVDDDLLMNRIGNRKFMFDFHGMNPEQADADFDKVHNVQKGSADKGEVERIRRADPISRDRTRTGSTKRRGVRGEVEASREQVDARIKQIERKIEDDLSSGSEEKDEDADCETVSAPPTYPASASTLYQSDGGNVKQKRQPLMAALAEKVADCSKSEGGKSVASSTKASSATPKVNKVDAPTDVANLDGQAFITLKDDLEYEVKILIKTLSHATTGTKAKLETGNRSHGEEG
jgi:hypothetical protein